MLESEFNRINLRKMVVKFYTSVLSDKLIGPIFIRKLGDDLSGVVWATHLDTITDFWASITLGDFAYKGSPFAPHMQLQDLSREAFQRWLELFSATLNSMYEPDLVVELENRSELIAANFMRNLRL